VKTRNEQLTTSELLFETACKDLGVEFERIRTAIRRRPDYKVRSKFGALVVEVKQVNPNDADKEYERQRKTTGRSFGGVSLERLRPLVADANGQLRPWAMRRIPTVVALYDSNPFQLYTEEHHVKSLFGDIGISIPVDGIGEPAQDVVFAKNQTLSDQKNRSVSALLTIREAYRAPTVLTLYHNPFARQRLKAGCAKDLGIAEVSWNFEVD
jgi:hypothetical protein